ncbi:MAG: hypothetical protein OEV60_03445, partial [Actinomycetota bacterium]|nr:hypothetical protein [Actinomycetota bacterium]
AAAAGPEDRTSAREGKHGVLVDAEHARGFLLSGRAISGEVGTLVGGPMPRQVMLLVAPG